MSTAVHPIAKACSLLLVLLLLLLLLLLNYALCETSFCRFMGIAEQMGRTLQRTSISVNIKERLDFSCALFGPDGSLVANAPHLPVHLGAMSEANRFQVTPCTLCCCCFLLS